MAPGGHVVYEIQLIEDNVVYFYRWGFQFVNHSYIASHANQHALKHVAVDYIITKRQKDSIALFVVIFNSRSTV